jgi:hypothetical protein
MQVGVDIAPVFAVYLARNRGPVPANPDVRQPPDYGVSARLHGAVVELALTFRAGSAYCCDQWGCHLDLYEGKRWERLRRELSARGIEVPSRLELRLTVVVEAGALFFDFGRPDPSRRGWYEFAAAVECRYQHMVAEGGNADA